MRTFCRRNCRGTHDQRAYRTLRIPSRRQKSRATQGKELMVRWRQNRAATTPTFIGILARREHDAVSADRGRNQSNLPLKTLVRREIARGRGTTLLPAHPGYFAPSFSANHVPKPAQNASRTRSHQTSMSLPCLSASVAARDGPTGCREWARSHPHHAADMRPRPLPFVQVSNW